MLANHNNTFYQVKILLFFRFPAFPSGAAPLTLRATKKEQHQPFP